MTTPLKFRRGQIIIFTSGEYSDFGLSGFLVAIQDIDVPALAREFTSAERAALVERGAEDWERPDPDDFPSWLVAKGYAMPVEATTVYLGHFTEWVPYSDWHADD